MSALIIFNGIYFNYNHIKRKLSKNYLALLPIKLVKFLNHLLMLLFKRIHIYNDHGILGTMAYLRNVGEGEIEVTALGAVDDSLDSAIIGALQSHFENCRFYESFPIEEHQIEALLATHKGEKTIFLKLLLINQKVYEVNLKALLNEENPQARNVKSLNIQYKTTEELTDKMLKTIQIV